jgi:hypothetical protein
MSPAKGSFSKQPPRADDAASQLKAAQAKIQQVCTFKPHNHTASHTPQQQGEIKSLQDQLKKRENVSSFRVAGDSDRVAKFGIIFFFLSMGICDVFDAIAI